LVRAPNADYVADDVGVDQVSIAVMRAVDGADQYADMLGHA
jgi:hypothetical protein